MSCTKAWIGALLLMVSYVYAQPATPASRHLVLGQHLHGEDCETEKKQIGALRLSAPGSVTVAHQVSRGKCPSLVRAISMEVFRAGRILRANTNSLLRRQTLQLSTVYLLSALLRRGEPPAPYLDIWKHLLSSHDPVTVNNALGEIRSTRERSLLDLARPLVFDKNPSISIEAAHTLLAMGDDLGAVVIHAHTMSRDPIIRRLALSAATDVRSHLACSILDVMSDIETDPELRMSLQAVLSERPRTGRKPLVDLLCGVAQSGSEPSAQVAARLLLARSPDKLDLRCPVSLRSSATADDLLNAWDVGGLTER